MKTMNAWRTSVVLRWYHFGTNVAPQEVDKVSIVVCARGQERTKSGKSGCPHAVLQLNETTINTCSTFWFLRLVENHESHESHESLAHICGATLVPLWYQRGTTES